MSVKIRLSRTGTKNAPMYRVVAVDSHAKRDGQALEILGAYNPRSKKFEKLNEARMEEWIKQGALMSETIKKLHKNYKKQPKA